MLSLRLPNKLTMDIPSTQCLPKHGQVYHGYIYRVQSIQNIENLLLEYTGKHYVVITRMALQEISSIDWINSYIRSSLEEFFSFQVMEVDRSWFRPTDIFLYCVPADSSEEKATAMRLKLIMEQTGDK